MTNPSQIHYLQTKWDNERMKNESLLQFLRELLETHKKLKSDLAEWKRKGEDTAGEVFKLVIALGVSEDSLKKKSVENKKLKGEIRQVLGELKKRPNSR